MPSACETIKCRGSPPIHYHSPQQDPPFQYPDSLLTGTLVPWMGSSGSAAKFARAGFARRGSGRSRVIRRESRTPARYERTHEECCRRECCGESGMDLLPTLFRGVASRVLNREGYLPLTSLLPLGGPLACTGALGG